MTNQHLVDYTVRNITTGDEEDIRVLELDPDEMLEFPPLERDEIIALIDDAQQTGSHWTENQDRILDLLLPHISQPELYRKDYAAWERMVLQDERILDATSPEDVAFSVRQILNRAVDGAIENWNEGFWEDFHPTTTHKGVLEMFIGWIQSGLDIDLDESLSFPLVEPPQDC